MSREAVLRLLAREAGYLSGEKMSLALGISRAAVWKSISALREAGYEIEARTNRGYRLLSLPDTPYPEAIWPLLSDAGLVQEIIYLDQVDSTNSELKRMAASGAPHGTVVIAGEQTGGRGRLGRDFVSLAGKGLFFSLLLRPAAQEATQPVTRLTAFSAVAVCEAISKVAAVSPRIKWVNDVLVGDRKLCGILTEMAVVGEMGQVDYVVVGAGVNVHYRAADFPADVRSQATSLAMLSDAPHSLVKLAAELILAFSCMYKQCSVDPAPYVARYRELSATVGRDILVLRGDKSHPAHALEIDDDCGLVVCYPNGVEETLYYGETSIRGADGYV